MTRDAVDFAVFWDYMSLHQEPRTPAEDRQFESALKSSVNLWYGHRHTVIWIQSKLPRSFNFGTYDTSGWCFIESSRVAAKAELACLLLSWSLPR